MNLKIEHFYLGNIHYSLFKKIFLFVFKTFPAHDIAQDYYVTNKKIKYYSDHNFFKEFFKYQQVVFLFHFKFRHKSI